jgi:hypothetical protein
MIPPVSRAESLAIGLDRYFTGKPCLNGHIFARRTDNGMCLLCEPLHRKKNKGPLLAGGLRWRDRNPDYKAAVSGGRGAWRRNPLCRDTRFTTKDFVRFYAEARRLTKETGVRHEVDHIVAIKDGGMHSPDNLQVITRAENHRKRRKSYDP